jgi:hypothetical protein
MLMRTAKSCGSDAPMLASSLREEAQATVSNKRGHRGEREVSRKTIARGMPGETGVTVVTMLVCFVLFRTRGCGRIERPAFPAPSEFRGREIQVKLARNPRRDREAVFVHGGLFENRIRTAGGRVSENRGRHCEERKRR